MEEYRYILVGGESGYDFQRFGVVSLPRRPLSSELIRITPNGHLFEVLHVVQENGVAEMPTLILSFFKKSALICLAIEKAREHGQN